MQSQAAVLEGTWACCRLVAEARARRGAAGFWSTKAHWVPRLKGLLSSDLLWLQGAELLHVALSAWSTWGRKRFQHVKLSKNGHVVKKVLTTILCG